MCANIDSIRSLIDDRLVDLDRLLNDFERRCVLIEDNRMRFKEIKKSLDVVRENLKSIKNKPIEKEGGQEEEMQGRVVDIPADEIEQKVTEEKIRVNFRDKKVRKAPSWKYLDKWSQILDQKLAIYDDTNNNDPNTNHLNNINGVNLVLSNKMQLKNPKFNSTECLSNNKLQLSYSEYSYSHKRYASEGDLLDEDYSTYNELNYRNVFHNSGYLLSLRDLQSFDRLDNLDGRLSSDSNESDNDSPDRKPKIVGVIYKDKL